MANPDLLLQGVRKSIIQDIKSFENQNRKKQSLKDYEVYNDRAYQYVYDKIAFQLSQKTANSMPIVANLNIAKRLVKQVASIYNNQPERSFGEISDADKESVEELYFDCGFDTSLAKANAYYALRNQSFVQVIPKNKKLLLRVLHSHNIDVIPDENDPENAYAYIVSSFDKAEWIKSDGVNQKTADADDYKSSLEKYQVWTKEITFVMNGKGEVVSEVIPNPIGELPFVDISKDKDFEFFVRLGQALSDFTIDFNVAWSDLMYTNRLQGFSLGVLSGDPNLKPDDMTIGPNKLLFLPINPDKPDSKLEIDFKNPSPNIEASIKVIESMLSTFLTTRGLSSKTIQSSNSSSNFSSGMERLLAQIEQFEATKDDFDLFKSVEKHVYMIITKWLKLLSGTDQLDRKYWVSPAIDSSDLEVNFYEPQMLETKSEMLANVKAKIELGISDKAMALAEVDNISLDRAELIIDEIEQRKLEKLVKLLPVDGVVDGTNQNQS